MTRLLYVDVVGGAAGDMLLAALIDAGASEARIREAVDAILPGRFRFRTEAVSRGGLGARWLRVEPGSEAVSRDARPRRFPELTASVDRAPLPPSVARAARSVLQRLGEAEARVHGVDLPAVVLHELGEDDTLLDVVGVASALDALGVEQVLISPLPVGGPSTPDGSVRHGEGSVPLPAPVTMELLRGFEIRGGPPGEPVTPTAAAIFAALGRPATTIPPMRLEAIGYGAGTRDPEDVPNVVRVLVGTSTDQGLDEELLVRDLAVMEANLDDLTPELTADAVEALFAAGALDVWVTPATMKKGRPGFVLSALGSQDGERALAKVFFESTSTFGVRSQHVRRTELARRVISVPLADGQVRVKVGLLGARVVSATPEHDDVVELARRAGRPVREMYEEAAAAARAFCHEGAQP